MKPLQVLILNFSEIRQVRLLNNNRFYQILCSKRSQRFDSNIHFSVKLKLLH